MKPTAARKQRQNKGEKERRVIKKTEEGEVVIKNKKHKHRKDENGQIKRKKKLTKKAIKEEPKMNVLTHKLLAFTLSYFFLEYVRELHIIIFRRRNELDPLQHHPYSHYTI
jgi:hypothetical protein